MSRSDGGAHGTSAGEPAAAQWVLLEQAVEAIGTALNERRTCEELTAFLCRHLCDAAAVELTREASDTRPPGGTVRVAADPNGLLLAPASPSRHRTRGSRSLCRAGHRTPYKWH